MPGRRGRLKRKVCTKCKAILPYNTQKCPYCGNTVFGEEFIGMVGIIDPEKSEIAKKLGIKQQGFFALKVKY